MTQIVHNFLTAKETNFLLSYYESKPYTSEKFTEYQGQQIAYNRHKNSDYDLTSSPVYHLLYPKLKKLLGPHIMDSGALLESYYPYTIHLDTAQTFRDYNFYSHNKIENCLNIAVLISLNEDPSFKTVMFDYFADTIDVAHLPKIVPSNNITSLDQYNLDLQHLTVQELKFVKNLKISDVYDWTAGGLVTWDRNQLHCSSNFYPSGKQKKAIVLFL